LFTNLLIVLNKQKVPLFQAEIIGLMDEYYKVLDAAEDKRLHEAARL